MLRHASCRFIRVAPHVPHITSLTPLAGWLVHLPFAVHHWGPSFFGSVPILAGATAALPPQNNPGPAPLLEQTGMPLEEDDPGGAQQKGNEPAGQGVGGGYAQHLWGRMYELAESETKFFVPISNDRT